MSKLFARNGKIITKPDIKAIPACDDCPCEDNPPPTPGFDCAVGSICILNTSPSQVELTFGGINQGTINNCGVADCTGLNSTFILDQHATRTCEYSFYLPPSDWCQPATGRNWAIKYYVQGSKCTIEIVGLDFGDPTAAAFAAIAWRNPPTDLPAVARDCLIIPTLADWTIVGVANTEYCDWTGMQILNVDYL